MDFYLLAAVTLHPRKRLETIVALKNQEFHFTVIFDLAHFRPQYFLLQLHNPQYNSRI